MTYICPNCFHSWTSSEQSKECPDCKFPLVFVHKDELLGGKSLRNELNREKGYDE